MRKLSQIEESRIKLLTKNAVSLTLIEPTATGLKKSIMDATGTVRNYLKKNKLHDYSNQGKGSQYKVIVKGVIYENYSITKTQVSLYRPKTKDGDPRIWLYGLTQFCNANDIIAIMSPLQKQTKSKMFLLGIF